MPKPSHGRAALNAAAFTFLVTLALPHAQAASTASASLSNIQFKVSDRLLSDGVEPSFVLTALSGNNVTAVDVSAMSRPGGNGIDDAATRTYAGDLFRPLSLNALALQSSAYAEVSGMSFEATGSAGGVNDRFSASAGAYAINPELTNGLGPFAIQLAPRSQLDISADAAVEAWASCFPSKVCNQSSDAFAKVSLGLRFRERSGFGGGDSDGLSTYVHVGGQIGIATRADREASRLSVTLVNDSDQWLGATFSASALVYGYSGTQVASIPEPATTGLMALGLVAVCAAAKRQRKRLPASLAA